MKNLVLSVNPIVGQSIPGYIATPYLAGDLKTS